MKISLLLGLFVCFSFTLCEEGYIWVITDFHYDPTYETTQESCNEDIPPEELGEFGNVECDSPLNLVEVAVDGMQNIGHTPDMIFWIGDSTHHVKDSELLDVESVIDAIRACGRLILNAFPNTEVYPIMGNHDYYPTSQLPGERNPLYIRIGFEWRNWLLTREAGETFSRGSYYTLTSKIAPNLRIVALNTNLYLEYNEATLNQTDPAGQLEWFEEVMTNARTNNEKVQLLTHVPTGTLGGGDPVRWIREPYNTYLNHLYKEYADVIIGIHSAHEHMDSFRLLFGDNDEPLASILVSPSVTPWRAYIEPGVVKEARNPALRAVRYDRDTLEMLDVEQYYVDLDAANEAGQAEWLLEYSFTADYGVPDMSPQSLADLADTFAEKDSENFNLYYKHNSVSVDHESVPEECDCECKRSHLCSIEFVNFGQYDDCLGFTSCPGSGHANSIRCQTGLLIMSIITGFFHLLY